MRYSILAAAASLAFTAAPAVAGTGQAAGAQSAGYHTAPMSADRGTPVTADHLTRTGAAIVDPVVRQGQRDAGAGVFYLNNKQQAEKADFQRPQNLAVCLSRRGSDLAHASVWGGPGKTAQLVPFNVSWRGHEARVTPGNCLYVRTAHIRVSAAKAVPNGETLRGEINVEAPRGAMQNP